MKRLLPHICVDMSLIFLTLWVIDRVNPMMHMLSRDVFKIPLMIFLVLVIIQAIIDIARQRADWRSSEYGRSPDQEERKK